MFRLYFFFCSEIRLILNFLVFFIFSSVFSTCLISLHSFMPHFMIMQALSPPPFVYLTVFQQSLSHDLIFATCDRNIRKQNFSASLISDKPSFAVRNAAEESLAGKLRTFQLSRFSLQTAGPKAREVTEKSGMRESQRSSHEQKMENRERG